MQMLLKFLGGNRMTEMPALEVAAAGTGQQHRLFEGFHAFGQNRQFQCAAQSDARFPIAPGPKRLPTFCPSLALSGQLGLRSIDAAISINPGVPAFLATSTMIVRSKHRP